MNATVRTIAATSLATAALLAAVAGRPEAAAPRVDVARLAGEIEREEDHVTALEVAKWIREGRPHLRVVDLRPAAEFEAYHVPGSKRMALQALVAEEISPADTIVLVSGGGAHAAQAWVLLQGRGFRRVYFLRGGLQEWSEDVMNPTIARDAPAREKEAFREVSALSRYFGGVPRVVAAGTKSPSSPQSAAAWRRRGC